MEYVVTKKKPLIGRQKYSWRLVAGNGRIIAIGGEKFVNKEDVESSIKSVQATDSTTTIRWR